MCSSLQLLLPPSLLPRPSVFGPEEKLVFARSFANDFSEKCFTLPCCTVEKIRQCRGGQTPRDTQTSHQSVAIPNSDSIGPNSVVETKQSRRNRSAAEVKRKLVTVSHRTVVNPIPKLPNYSPMRPYSPCNITGRHIPWNPSPTNSYLSHSETLTLKPSNHTIHRVPSFLQIPNPNLFPNCVMNTESPHF